MPISEEYVYSGLITGQTEPDPLTEPMAASYEEDIDNTITQAPVPTGDIGGYEQPLSAQEALYQAYTNYADTIDLENAELYKDIVNQMTINEIKYNNQLNEKPNIVVAALRNLPMGIGMATRALFPEPPIEDSEVFDVRFRKQEHMTTLQEKIDSEYALNKKFKYNFQMWKQKTQNGTLPEFGYIEPNLDDERIELDWMDKDLLPGQIGSMRDGVEGALKGLELIDQTGLVRIALMGMAGMPEGLVGSMALSTAGYGTLQRIAGRQDNLSADMSNVINSIRDKTNTSEVSTEEWKRRYTELNKQANAKGIIKGTWTLRLSRNMPIKDKYRRLYYTLLGEMEKK